MDVSLAFLGFMLVVVGLGLGYDYYLCKGCGLTKFPLGLLTKHPKKFERQVLFVQILALVLSGVTILLLSLMR